MNLNKIIPLMATALALSACGSNFEWFPKVEDSTPPAVNATISGKSIFNNQTTHVTSLPATVTFTSSEAATIYYTTNGTEPTTSSTAIDFVSASVSGPSITVTDTILKFFGIDKSAKKNQSATITSTIKMP